MPSQMRSNWAYRPPRTVLAGLPAPCAPGPLAGELAPQKHPVGAVLGLVDAVVAQATQESGEFGLVGRRHLHPDEYAPVVGPVVAVMKQADVPAAAHAVEEAHQRAGAFRELEAVEYLVLGVRRMAAHEMAHMQLGHLVVGQVVGLDPALVHRAQ